MFNSAGTFKAKIDDVKFAEPKFAQGANDFDICVHVISDDGQSDWWRGEVSQNYGKGTFATMTQAEITMKTLRSIGFEGEDLTTLKEQVVGREIPVTIKETVKDGKTYHNIHYIGGGGDQPVEIDAYSVKKRIAAMFGGAADEAPAQAAAKPTPSPFGKPAAATTAAPAAATAPKTSNPFARK